MEVDIECVAYSVTYSTYNIDYLIYKMTYSKYVLNKSFLLGSIISNFLVEYVVLLLKYVVLP